MRSTLAGADTAASILPITLIASQHSGIFTQTAVVGTIAPGGGAISITADTIV